MQSVNPQSGSKDQTIAFTVLGTKFEFSRNLLVAVLNELQPWKVPSYLIGIALVFFVFTGAFLNLWPESPFNKGGTPFVIQRFEVQRPIFQEPVPLAPNETLTLTAGEKAIIEVKLLGTTQVTCTWFVASGNQPLTGCSIGYNARTPGEPDSLSVFVRPECGSQEEAASLGIVVEP
jgi:hypothetical protein